MREVLRKQKTRRPERREITGAVSPKENRKKEGECPVSETSERRETWTEDRCGLNRAIFAILEVADDGATGALKIFHQGTTITVLRTRRNCISVCA